MGLSSHCALIRLLRIQLDTAWEESLISCVLFVMISVSRHPSRAPAQQYNNLATNNSGAVFIRLQLPSTTSTAREKHQSGRRESLSIGFIFSWKAHKSKRLFEWYQILNNGHLKSVIFLLYLKYPVLRLARHTSL